MFILGFNMPLAEYTNYNKNIKHVIQNSFRDILTEFKKNSKNPGLLDKL